MKRLIVNKFILNSKRHRGKYDYSDSKYINRELK